MQATRIQCGPPKGSTLSRYAHLSHLPFPRQDKMECRHRTLTWTTWLSGEEAGAATYLVAALPMARPKSHRLMVVLRLGGRVHTLPRAQVANLLHTDNTNYHQCHHYTSSPCYRIKRGQNGQKARLDLLTEFWVYVPLSHKHGHFQSGVVA